MTSVFSKLCALNTAAPDGILGVSAYKNPENFFTIPRYPAATRRLMEYMNTKFLYPHRQSLKTTDISKKMSNRFLKDSIRNVFPFSGYEYAGLPGIEVYPILHRTIQNGHFEVWIAVKKEKRIDMEYQIEIREIEPIRVASIKYKGFAPEANKVFPNVSKSIRGQANALRFLLLNGTLATGKLLFIIIFYPAMESISFGWVLHCLNCETALSPVGISACRRTTAKEKTSYSSSFYAQPNKYP